MTASDCEYSPSGAVPAVKVKFDNGSGMETLTEGKDYTISCSNNKAVGSKDAAKAPTVTINFKGNFKGKCTAKYNITKCNVTVADQVFKPGEAVYLSYEDITAKDPAKYSAENPDKNKLKDSDFEILADTYTGNNKKGTASVMIRGIGNYAGTKKITFKITTKIFN